MTTSNTIPLGLVSSGETVELVAIRGGHKLKKRLADLGLTVGMPVRVSRNFNHGPIVLAIKNDTRLAIGRGMALRIEVRPQHVHVEA
jgi:ferrous iron transport protein A